MRGWKRAVRHRVVVNLLSGTAVASVLLRQDGPLLFLRDATVHEPAAEPVTADGELLIERTQVDYIQIVG